MSAMMTPATTCAAFLCLLAYDIRLSSALPTRPAGESINNEIATEIILPNEKDEEVVMTTKDVLVTTMEDHDAIATGTPAVTDLHSSLVTPRPLEWTPSANFRERHECERPCGEGPSLTCRYTFAVQWYYTMSKACHACSQNASDCLRPECVAADGVKRPIIVVNKTIPGPNIEVCLGDYIVVDVVNMLMDESTSVHWHGHHQRGSPFMDGVPFVSQCPVAPNSAFRYQYSADNAGTHFWHSHTGVQRGDGSFGSLIIRQAPARDAHSSLYDHDLSEHVLVVLDWSHQLGVTMLTAHYHSDGDNKPESMLVNGRGRHFNNSRQLTNTPLEIFNVKQGVRYRFRLINAGVQNCPIDLTIDNHTLTIISTDGADVKPVNVSSLVSYAGERWDFVVSADAAVANYWMRFTGLMDCDQRFTSAHQVAVLHYEGAPFAEPQSPVGYNIHPTTHLQLNSLNVALSEEGTLSIPHLEAFNSKPDVSLKEIPDQQIYISFDFYPKDNPHYHKKNLYGFYEVSKSERVYTPQFNDISMRLPHFPLMSQFDKINQNTFCDHQTLKKCNQTFCECTNVINISLGNVVEIVLVDKGVTYNANHPFHLHGHPFRVVGMDRLAESVDLERVQALDREGGLVRNLTNPVLKDTVTVPDGGYTILRFHATNPGYWLFHCHIEFHVEVGMALIFKVGEHSDFLPVPEGFPRCGDYFGPPNVEHNVANEIDFGHGHEYNITLDNASVDDNFLSFTHWWHSPNSSFVTSDGITHKTFSMSLLFGVVFLSWLL